MPAIGTTPAPRSSSWIVANLLDLTTRTLEPELMDDPALDASEHERALLGLARVHRLTQTVARLWRPIERLATQRGLQRVSVLDVGCGDGYLLRKLYRYGRRSALDVRLIGCDFSEQALEFARELALRERIPMEFHCLDVTQTDLPCRADVVLCSLFLHHFTNAEVLQILRKLARQADHLVAIEDLLRSRWGYYLCLAGVYVLSRSPVVHTDGPLSVQAAFTLDEMQGLLDEAGLPGAQLRKHWPERFLVQWQAPRTPGQGGAGE